MGDRKSEEGEWRGEGEGRVGEGDRREGREVGEGGEVTVEGELE